MVEFSNQEPFIKPGAFNHKDYEFPETIIVSWQFPIFEALHKKHRLNHFKQKVYPGGVEVTVYYFKENKKKIGFALLPLGGPASAYCLECFKEMGAVNIVCIGSCGVLSDDVKNSIIIPTQAYRDEGTSGHYTPSFSDYINVTTFSKLSDFLFNKKINYDLGITWTTDAIFRETPYAISCAKEKGCVVVDMECASIMAVAKLINLNVYQAFFAADKFSKETWNKGKLNEQISNDDFYTLLINLIIEFSIGLC